MKHAIALLMGMLTFGVKLTSSRYLWVAFSVYSLGRTSSPSFKQVTARCLESLIRLSTATAKVRLSDHVTVKDCMTAFNLLSFALYGDADYELRSRQQQEPEVR